VSSARHAHHPSPGRDETPAPRAPDLVPEPPPTAPEPAPPDVIDPVPPGSGDDAPVREPGRPPPPVRA
jgi:hypothetical protein